MNPSMLPGILSNLYLYEGACMNHINNGTFDEDPFVEYFKNWDDYYYIISRFGVKDTYDASNLRKIAEYYNEKTKTTNYYNPSTGEKGTQPPKYYSNGGNTTTTSTSSSNDDMNERIKNIAIGAGIAVAVIFLLRSCARGEEIKDKYTLVDNNGKKIEFMNNNYQKYDINNEVINPMDYPIKSR
jgi:hypothetical protein